MNNLHIKLIDEDYIKSRSSIMNSVENTFIRNNILIAQDLHLQDIIGTDLYDDIISEYESYFIDVDLGVSGITEADYVSEEYLTLVHNYIQPCVLYYTLYESVYDLYSKIANKSIVTQNSDNSTVVDESFMEKRKKDFLNKAEYYSKRLSNFLEDNYQTYPKYNSSGGNFSDIIPNNQAYLSNGWYLKKSGCRISKNNDLF